MEDKNLDIEELIIRYCEGNVSENERCYVENWMSESEENFQIVHKMYTVICKHSKKCTFYTLRFGCSFAAVNTIKPQLL